MAQLRCGLIGCGFFAQNHLHAWGEIEPVRVAALCDRDSGRLETTGRAFGVDRLYADAETMLSAEALDFVDIATPVQTHRPLVELAARHGVAVICQKPFAESMADAAAMVTACNEAGVPLMVHENFRWQSPIRAVRAAIEAGSIGEPFWGRISFRSAYDVYSGQPYLATDERFIIQDLGIHTLDVARFLFGDVGYLTATTQRVNPAIRGEDVATFLLSHLSGATSVVDCSYSTVLEEELFPQTLVEVDGTAGTIRLGANYRLTISTRAGTGHRDVSPPVLPWTRPPWHSIAESVRNIQAHWTGTLRRGIKSETSGEDNLKTLALVYAGYKSAAGQQSVELAT